MAELSLVRRQLAAELAKLRAMSGRAGRAMGPINQARVSRIESGKVLPSRTEVLQWLDVTVALPDERERVLAFVEAAHSETRPWADILDGRAHLQDEAQTRNAAAALIRNYQPTVVPGLLQTASYGRYVLEFGRTDVAAALAARLDRQQLLYEPDRRFEFLLAERVLRWEPGPGALLGQLEHLASVATLESVDLAVVPESAAVAMAWHNFVLRTPADGGPPYVTTELVHGAQEISDPASVGIYMSLWDRLWEAAVVGSEAVRLIRSAALSG